MFNQWLPCECMRMNKFSAGGLLRVQYTICCFPVKWSKSGLLHGGSDTHKIGKFKCEKRWAIVQRAGQGWVKA